jgi:hypothetical protein
VSAGAIEAGLDCLRRAVHLSVRIDDPPLQIRALTSLGSALVLSGLVAKVAGWHAPWLAAAALTAAAAVLLFALRGWFLSRAS